jgi:cytochrome c553
MAEASLICGSRGRRVLLCGGAILLIGITWSVCTAQVAFPEPEQPTAERGHAIAVGGGPGGAGAACFSCHGLEGQGDAGAAFPRLAGLDAQYLARQMADYASGARPNAVMTPIAQQLSPTDHQSVALYYAGLPPQAPIILASAVDAGSLQWGGILYAQGSAERGIQACANCHGPGGQGLNDVYPGVAGQPAAYVEAQFRLWRNGTRQNDIGDVMGSVARRMTDQDIRAVSAYVAGLAP